MYKSLELQILKEEESVLKDIEAKLRSQLTRLKVEELTLVNHARSAEAGRTSSALSDKAEPVAVIDQLGAQLQSEKEQNAKPLLDLDVKNQLLMLMGEEDEEEEEEEELEDEDDITEHDQLTAFMKQMEQNAS